MSDDTEIAWHREQIAKNRAILDELEVGKPPHLPDVLDECGRHSDRLIQLHDNIEKLGQTHNRLKKLIEFTEDS